MPVIQTITSASGTSAYVPTARQLTINGVTYDLTADRSWTIEVLDNLIATAPLSYDSVTNTISISQASASTNGFLSSADWLTFSSKQPAITLTTTGNSGASTFNVISGALNIPEYTLIGLGGFANPMTTLGDLIIARSTGEPFRFGGNSTTTRKYLSQIGDGTSVVSSSWEEISTTTLNAVPTSRTITINGTTLDLSANRTFSVGTVTSVGLTMPVGFSVASSPVTSSGTIAVTLSSGYLIPTTAQEIEWNQAYTNRITLLTTTGNSGAATLVSNTLNIPEYTLAGLGGFVNPMTTTGDIIVARSTGEAFRFGGNTSTTRKFFSQIGNGTAVTSSSWYEITASDVGAVSSVGLTMPSAFSVSGSPITSSGTLAVTANGNATQYIRGDGALADFPTTTGGGGASVSYYLNGSVNQGTFGGNVYYEMDKSAVIGGGTDFSIGANGYIASFITDANVPNAILIPSGNWNLEFYFSASSSGGSPSFYVELYKYNGTTFTLIASNSSSPELIAFGTTINPYFSSLAVPETTLLATDRLAIRVYVTHSGRTITLHTEDNHLCQIITTFTTGLTALNNLTKQVQYLATGISGTDFNISSVTDTHTFNLPTASATNRGALSTTDWTTFNSKQNALNGTGFVKISGTTISYDNSTYYLASNPSAYITLTSLSAGAGISYNNTTGVIASTITQYTDALARLAISESVTGLDYNNTTGVFSLTSGYVIPTTTSATNWDAAYNDKINSASVTGTTTKTLTLTQQDGGTITAIWTDINTDAVTSVFGRTGAVVAQSGDYNTSQVTESGNLYYLDSRARAALSFTAGSGAYNSTTGVITIPTNTNQLTNGAAFITLTSLSAGSGISYNNTTGVITSTITQYTDALARASISETITGIDYNNTTGVFSITAGYGIPTTTSQTNWDTAYTNRITSLTTTGSSGAATLISNTLNIPNYTAAGLGAVPTSRTITINDVVFDLSANRSWDVGDFGTW